MKSILVVVDMQNGFNRYDHMKKLADRVIKITNSNIFDCIIATRFINYEGSQYTKFLNWHRLIDEKDIDLMSNIKYDKVVEKNVYSSFHRLNNLEEGTILFTNPKQGLFIKAKQGILQILEIQAENAKRMSTSEFLRGNSIQAGSILE